MHSQKLGKKGEDIASNWLQKQGYKIIKRNHRQHNCGEIDIIAKDPKHNVLVFVEVKTRSNQNFGLARESVNFRKQQKLRKTAYFYLIQTKQEEQDFRIDLIEVTPTQENWHINHLQNIIEE